MCLSLSGFSPVVKISCPRRAAGLLGLVLVVCLPVPGGAQMQYRAVAVTGQTGVPGAGGTFDGFEAPTMNATGKVAFGGEYGDESGVFVASPLGVLSDIARTDGDFAPGTNANFYDLLIHGSALLVNDDGDVAFAGSYFDGQYIRSGLWSNESGTLMDVVLDFFTEAPGSGGKTFIDVASNFNLTSAGLSFVGTYQLGDDVGTRGSGIYTTQGGDLEAVVQTDEVAPGALAPFTSLWIPLSSQGPQLSFVGEYDLGGIEEGLFRYGTADIDVVRTHATQVPGTTSTFSRLNFHDMNAAGTVAFVAEYSDDTEQGLFVFEDGVLRDLFRSDGGPFPGTDWQPTRCEKPRIDNAGHIGVFATFSDENGLSHDAIFTDASGGFAMLARRHAEPAPQWDGPFTGFRYYPGVTMNDRGQVAFYGLVGGGWQGIWASHGPGRDLVAVAVHGQSWDLDGLPGGESRVVDKVDLVLDSGGDDGRASAFNDAGEIAFRIEFTAASGGGEGVYVATVPFFETPSASYGFSVGSGDVPTLYRFSPLSGESYPVVKLSLPPGASTPVDVEGLCLDDDGTLWAIDCENDVLMTIDPVSGRVELIGGLGVDTDDVGLVFGPLGQLLMADAGTGTLYSVDSSSGAASPVGPLGAGIDSLAWHEGSSTLYGMSEDGPYLYTVNPMTGAAALLSTLMSVPQTNNTGLTVDGDGVLWGLWEDTDPVGEETVIFTIDNPGAGTTTVRGVIASPDPLAGQFESFTMLPPGAARLFADGFESGNTSAWSATLP